MVAILLGSVEPLFAYVVVNPKIRIRVLLMCTSFSSAHFAQSVTQQVCPSNPLCIVIDAKEKIQVNRFTQGALFAEAEI